MIKINGVLMPSPSSMVPGFYDVSTIGDRNALGDALIDRVATKRKYELQWNYPDALTLKTLLTAIGEAGTSSVFFSFTCVDPAINAEATKTFYAGDRMMPVYRYNNGSPIYEYLKVSFIQK
jgi:hypothetical protein